MKTRSLLLMVMMIGLPSILSVAQADHPRVVTPTIPVIQFTELEKQLAKAIKEKDNSQLNALLADTFEVWSPSALDPTSREDWIAESAQQQKLISFRSRQMAVESLNQISVVSFLADEKTEKQGKSRSQEYFVVDIWTPKGDGWQLAVRYLSRLAAAPQVHPAPTGRE